MAEHKYTATVKIAVGGTQHAEFQADGTLRITNSAAGHMWISASDGVTAPISVGFGPKISSPLWKGEAKNNDDTAYQDTFYTVTFPINKEQYDKLLDYTGILEKGGFDVNGVYFAGSKSCIDAVYQALKAIGVNVHLDPLFGDTYEGNVMPKNNVEAIDVMLYQSIYGSNDYNFKENWHNGELVKKDVVYTENNDRIVFNKTTNQTTITTRNPENLNKLIQKVSNMGVDIKDYKKSEVTINAIAYLQITADTKFQEKGEYYVEKYVDNKATIPSPIYAAKGYSPTDDINSIPKNIEDMTSLELMKHWFKTDLNVDEKEFDELANAIKNDESTASSEAIRKNIEETTRAWEKAHNSKDDDDNVHRR